MTDQLSADAFRKVYLDLQKHGKKSSPRGLPVLELEHYTYELPPYVRFPSFASRKLKTDYTRREFLWYLRGNAYDLTITDHAAIWRDIVNHDSTINSNYGQYIFARKDAYIVGQEDVGHIRTSRSAFEYVVNELITDKDSRRASIPILSLAHVNMVTKDLPCTYSLNFRIRDNQLNMSVHMRSQDAIFGMGNDAPCFSFIHEMVYAALAHKYPDLTLGTYKHTADSFHVYERHFKMLEQICSGDEYIPQQVPKISGLDEVKHLMFDIHLRYPLGKHAWCYNYIQNITPITLSFEQKSSAYEQFAFSSWLLEPELTTSTVKAQ